MSAWDNLRSLSSECTWPEFVDFLAQSHYARGTWQSLPLKVWLLHLRDEMVELEAAITDLHEHPWELEAAEIASVCINMLRVHGTPLAHLVESKAEQKEETC